MINQKTLKVLAGALLAIFVSVVGLAAYAEQMDDHMNARMEKKMEKKMEKTIHQTERKLETFENHIEDAWGLNDGNKRAVTMQSDGTYRVSGVEVKGVNAASNTLTVEFFGFTRDVSVAGAKLRAPGGKEITLADFQVGDKLMGKGSFNPSTRAITVNEVHNFSYRNRASADINGRIQELLDMIHKLQDQIKTLRQ